MNKTTLSDLATIAHELAAGEGNIWCMRKEVAADTAYNLAESGRSFMYLPLHLVRDNHDQESGISILVFNDKQGISDCVSINGPRQEFQQAIEELKMVTEKLTSASKPTSNADDDVVSIQLDRKTADLFGRLLSRNNLLVDPHLPDEVRRDAQLVLERLKDILNKRLYNGLNWL
jgi:hypothetical protein